MLVEQTMEKLRGLGLSGMTEALRRWEEGTDRTTGAPELVGLLADAEWIERENRRLATRLRVARLRESGACVEDLDYRAGRGLAKQAVLEMAGGRWIVERQNLIVTGPTGTGKTYLACALGQKACRDGFTVIYARAARLYDDLEQARGDGSYRKVLARMAKAKLLILDDFGMEPLDSEARRNLLEVIEDRAGSASTLVTSQLDPKNWHGVIGDQTIADAICDRIVHHAHRIKLAGESLRKTRLTEGKRAQPALPR